ncbi:MAG TPA: hypothetical protein VD736_01140, partial [Nitrososphaera sp.]|nr:hypothetical protein [Nitrososphaera sp.]
GIGRDQSEVFKAKSRFAELDPQNASAFWGETEKLLPAIGDRSIDNFLMVLPEHSAPLNTTESKSSFRSMLATMSKKLTRGGSLRILTDMEMESAASRDLVSLINQAGFQLVTDEGKEYFPEDWRDPDFSPDKRPHVVVFAPK